MARDYRYGHKEHQPIHRRSQSEDDIVASRPKVPKKAQPESDVIKKARDDAGPKTKPRLQHANNAVLIDNIRPNRSPDLQKALDRACAVSHSYAMRKEAEAEARALAEQHIAETEAADRLRADAEAKIQKTKGKLWVWGGSIALVSVVTLWLFYAPFFLAFAYEMNWISEETRVRWDSSAVRKQVMVLNDAQLTAPASVDIPTTASSETPPVVQQPSQPAPMTFTFYQELPRAAIHLAAQPLPVRTRAPVYLQVATIAVAKEASAERHRLAQKGYLVQMSTQIRQGKPVYVLRMGPYDDQRVINRLKVELQRLGVDAKEVNMVTMAKSEAASLEPAQTPVSPSITTMPKTVPSTSTSNPQSVPASKVKP